MLRLTTCLLLLTTASYPQDNCLSLVRQAYENMNSAGREAMQDGRAFYVHYTVTVAARDTAFGVQKTDIGLWASGSRMHVVSDQIELYQDDREAFTVVPAGRTIYRSDAVPGSLMETRNKHIFALQDTLFAMASVRECGSAKGYGNAGRKVVLEISAAGRKLFGIRRITFFLDERKKEMKTVRIEYVSPREAPGRADAYPASAGLAGGIRYVEYTFKTVDYNHSTTRLGRPVAKQFIKTGNRLLPEYEGWTLVDNRGKKMQ